MQISSVLQKELNKAVPKEKQTAFVESAIQKALNEHEKTNAPILELFVDGGSRGNPGPSGGGFVGFLKGKKVLGGSEFYGVKTNNQAEYLALRTALREAFSQFPDKSIRCFMDSQLVVEQMNGNYKVRNETLRPLFTEVQRITGQLKSFEIRHVERAQNSLADQLANEAMDRKS